MKNNVYIEDSEEYYVKGSKGAELFTIKISNRKNLKNESPTHFGCSNFIEILNFLRERKGL